MVSKNFTGFEKRRSGHRSLRTCIGCRKKEKPQLLVSVHCVVNSENDEAELVFNARRRNDVKISGRGAWLHHDTSCFNKAVKKNALSLIFKARTKKTNFLCPTLTDFKDTVMTKEAGGKRMETR